MNIFKYDVIFYQHKMEITLTFIYLQLKTSLS